MDGDEERERDRRGGEEIEIGARERRGRSGERGGGGGADRGAERERGDED